MISRIILLENNINFTKKIRFPLPVTYYDGRLQYSVCRPLQNKNQSISKHVKSPDSFKNKAKEATKTTYYTAIVVAGIGAFSLMMYAIFKELISSFSPQAVYSCAVNKVCANAKVVEVFGENIKCFGETSRRGRRQHVNNLPYEIDGRKGFRIMFYLQGQFRSGTVNLDARECSSGWEFRYLYVQSDSYPRQVVVVEDNRSLVDVDDRSGTGIGTGTGMQASSIGLPSLADS